ncbi:hypothetical protein Bbelb_436790 [Branchiostoma belcheri]|nr:hypothetical protein Bbelb_436790 [Branchiostoma belcheri]
MALEVRCHLRAQANLGPGLNHRMEIRLTERLHFEFERLGPGRFYEVGGRPLVGDVDATHCTVKLALRLRHSHTVQSCGVASKQATSVRRHDEKDMPTQRTNHPEVSPWITGELVCVTVFGLVWGWIESRRYARVAASGELHRRWESVRASRDVREPRTAPPSERALHTVLERHCRVKEFPWGRGEVHVGVSQVSRDQFGRGRDNFTRLKAEFAIAKGGGVSARSGSDILIQYSHGGVASKQATSVRRHDEKDMPTQRTNHPEVSPWITGELVCVTVFGLVWGWIESRRYARVAASGELHRRWESVRASRDVREPRTAPPSERALHTVLERHCRVKEFPWGRGEVHVEPSYGCFSVAYAQFPLSASCGGHIGHTNSGDSHRLSARTTLSLGLGSGTRQSSVPQFICTFRVIVEGYIMPPALSKFNRQRSAGITFLLKHEAQFEDVIQLLTKHGVNLKTEVDGIQNKGNGRCEVTFNTSATLNRVGLSLSSDPDLDVELFGNGVTLVNIMGVPLEVDDNYIRHRLKEYGKIIDGKFLTYANRGFPEIKSGTRQYKMSLSKHIPNVLRVGNDNVSVKYPGQPRLCHRCGAQDHFVAACKVDKCGRCHQVGHKTVDCEGSIRCNVCSEEGHTSRSCKLSFANRLAMTTAWSKQAQAPAPQASAQTSVVKPTRPLVESESEEEVASDEEDTPPKKLLEHIAAGELDKVALAPAKPSAEAKGGTPTKPTPVVKAGATVEKARATGSAKVTTLEERVDTQEERVDTKKICFTDSLVLAGLPEDGANKLPDTGELTEPGMSLNLSLPLSGDLVISEFTSTSSEEDTTRKRTDKSSWSRQWGHTAVWSLGTNSARGVGILLSQKWTLVSSNVDSDGRVISVLISDGVSKFNIVNVYAPSTAGERAVFFSSLHEYMFPNAAPVLAGDFNCVLDPALDRYTTSTASPGSHTQDVLELRSLVSDLELKDTWRVEHPTQLEYTWRSPSNNTRSRLDRIYASDDLSTAAEIVSCPFSDHDANVTSVVPAHPVQQGRGVWKCNVKTLSDCLFVNELEEQYKGWKDQKSDHPSLRDWWDSVKVLIKDLVVKHSKRRAKEAKLIQKSLEKNLDLLRSRLNAGDRTPSALKEYEQAREKLNKLVQDRLEGQRLRSRIKNFEEGEKPTRFFFRSEREKGKKRLIKEIRNQNGDTVSTTDEVTDVFRDFYTRLFTKDQLNLEDREFFLDKLDTALPEEVSNCLERPLSSEELLSAIKGMANNKTPGSDGLPKEFYYKFWDLVGPDILEVFNEGLGDGLLTVSQRQGIITLLDKAGDPLDPANKRPISLLNVDYKILAKALANRLKRVISLVVNADQSCGIPGRSITDSVCLLRDIAAYANDKDLPCVFLALDQEKAFDRVDHEFMVSILEKLGFGPVFKSWIATLYNGASSNVLVNGNLSASIPVERGVRQGCPLSPLLYVLCIEPLAAAIRVDPHIKGVHLPGGAGKETKIVQYADDNTIVLSDDESIVRTFHLISKFESGTGSKLNMQKTEALWLGSWRGRSDKPFPIKRWDSTYLKLLGTPVGNIPLAEEAWLQRFTKFKARLDQWRGRN